MIKSKTNSIAKEHRSDSAMKDEVKSDVSDNQNDDGFDKLDNQYEAAGFVISSIFKNWKKFLILVLAILFTIGIILLLLLPGYKCQTETKTFEKSPVNIPVKRQNSATVGEY